MIKVFCCKCGDELDDLGGVLIGPPLGLLEDNEGTQVAKRHFCIDCYNSLKDWIKLGVEKE